MLTLVPGMPTSIWPVLICAVLAMIIGAIWYGPLFGKKWMEIIGADKHDEKRRKEMQKSAGPLYLVQFALVFVQVWFIGMVVNVWGQVAGQAPVELIVGRTLLLWLVFIMPTIAACSMWTADPGKVRWARFFIQSEYQLILFILFGLILGSWV